MIAYRGIGDIVGAVMNDEVKRVGAGTSELIIVIVGVRTRFGIGFSIPCKELTDNRIGDVVRPVVDGQMQLQ